MTTGPAPTLFGEIVTFAFVITPVSWSGTGGRGSFLKPWPLPQPASASATRPEATVTRRMRIVCRMTLIPRPGSVPLAEPDGSPARDQPIHLALDLAADPFGDRLDQSEVFSVLGSISIHRNGLKEP